MKHKTQKFIMIKYLLLPLLVLTGCEINPPTEVYKQFKKDHNNSTSYYYCDKQIGFLMKNQVYDFSHSVLTSIVTNDLDQPTRCGQSNIQVLETSYGTNRTF